jgi:hypothetical protein
VRRGGGGDVGSSALRRCRKAPAAVNMRSHGRKHVFVVCGNPDCHHNAEVDVSGLPDNVTFGDLQLRMLCTVCEHRAVMAASWLTGPAAPQVLLTFSCV